MLKPIQTRYKGYRFRSRLEARWAVFFDALGLKWEYEPEGFETGAGGRYLPDFRVHMSYDNTPVWFEIKPPLKTKPKNFLQFARKAPEVCVLLGNIPDPTTYYDEEVCPKFLWMYQRVRHTWGVEHGFWPYGYFCECIDCGAIEITLPWQACISDTCYGGPRNKNIEGPLRKTERIRDALRRARGARFEHGEQG